MKATGIVRRIDELGRVVVPKEIRRTLRIHEGDPLEIYTDRDGEIILKKYSPIGELGSYAQEFVSALSRTFSVSAAICDRDLFIAVGGNLKKELSEKPISGDIESLILARSPAMRTDANADMIRILDNDEREHFYAAFLVPIIALSDPIGAVLLLSKDETAAIPSDAIKSAEMVAMFLGKLMEQ